MKISAIASSIASIDSSDRLVEEVDLRMIKSTLVIMYCGRSGSYLLSNLMDGHSEILSCPPHSIAKVIENISVILLDARKKSQLVTPDYLVKGIVEHQPFLFKETDHTILTDDFEEELRLITSPEEEFQATTFIKGPKSIVTQNSEIGVNKSKFS